MKSTIREIISEVTKLDSWDILSAFGGVNYICRQAAINTAVKMMPDPPEEASGLESFTAWEQKMKDPAIKKAVTGMVYLADEFADVLNEYTDMPPSGFEEVLKFMTERPPRRETFKAEYDNRKRLGMRPQMPMSQFVDLEYAQALVRHNHLIARGEAAIGLLEGVEGSDDQAPDWLYEAIEQKVLTKLQDRWMRAELRRTNPKISKTDRDTAEANQRLIEAVLEKLGGEKPSYTEQIEAQDEVEEFLRKSNTIKVVS